VVVVILNGFDRNSGEAGEPIVRHVLGPFHACSATHCRARSAIASTASRKVPYPRRDRSCSSISTTTSHRFPTHSLLITIAAPSRTPTSNVIDRLLYAIKQLLSCESGSRVPGISLHCVLVPVPDLRSHLVH